MRIKRTDPGSGQPLATEELRESIKSAQFAETLSQLETPAANTSRSQAASASLALARTELAEIAQGVNFSDAAQTAMAVHQAARYLVRSRLQKKFQQTKMAAELVEGLSEFVATDPFLQTRLLSILTQLNNQAT